MPKSRHESINYNLKNVQHEILMLNKISTSSNKSYLFWQNIFEQIEISLTTPDNFGRL